MEKHGKRKAFYTGGNSTCRRHIHTHYKEYKARCEAANISEIEHAIPRNIVAERKKEVMSGQMTLDREFKKVAVRAFSRDDVLKSIAEFVVCDDQVSQH